MSKIIYFTHNGKTPFIDWLKTLDFTNQARIRSRLARMKKGNLGDCKLLSPNLYESRFFFGSGYRLYFTIRNGQIIIMLCGGDKKTQSKDIALAKKYLNLIGADYDR